MPLVTRFEGVREFPFLDRHGVWKERERRDDCETKDAKMRLLAAREKTGGSERRDRTCEGVLSVLLVLF